MLAARGSLVSHETVRQWARKFSQGFAHRIRRQLPGAGDKGPLDEVVITIAGETHRLWRAVDQHGRVLDVRVPSRRDEPAAERLLRQLLTKQGRAPRVLITDQLASSPAAKERTAMIVDKVSVRCCVVGGGPAGMMLGLLLARTGVDVLVLEKHADFLRDFRGDTIHPSTLEVMHELGVLEEFLRLPHQEARELNVQIGDVALPIADFTHLPTRCRFIAFMPQWDFLDFLAACGTRYPTFKLRMRTEATELVEEAGRVVGIQTTTPEGPLEVRADLVVGADGRHSVVREKAGLKAEAFGAPMDVLWFRLSRRPGDPDQTIGRFEPGRIFVLINRGDYWQCGYVIPKGSLDRIRGKGLHAFRDDVAQLLPRRAGEQRVEELRDWDQIKLLAVRVDRLSRWYRPGLLCIGDAAHAMSPVGGVGINLAIQDAVAAANLIAVPLREGRLTIDHLLRVQRRRELPTRVTQRLQILIQDRVITRVLGGSGRLSPPLAVRLMARFPFLRRIPARLVGIGIRPEHLSPAQP